jgi:hypothetical protein
VGVDGKNSRNDLCRRDSRRRAALRGAAGSRRPGRGVGHLPRHGDLDNNCFRARLRRRVADHRPAAGPMGTPPGDRLGSCGDGLVHPCGDLGAEPGRGVRRAGDLGVHGFDIGPAQLVPRRGRDRAGVRAARRRRFRPASSVRGRRGGLGAAVTIGPRTGAASRQDRIGGIGLHRVRRAAARPTVDDAPRQLLCRARVHRRDLHRRAARAARRRRHPEHPAVDGGSPPSKPGLDAGTRDRLSKHIRAHYF